MPDRVQIYLLLGLAVSATLGRPVAGQLGSENLYPELLWQGRGDMAPPANSGRPDLGKLPASLKKACDDTQTTKSSLDPQDGDTIDDNHAYEGCLRSLCEPICLRQMITCTVSGEFIAGEFGDHYSEAPKSEDHLAIAICAQLQAYLCSVLVPICPAVQGDRASDADWLYRWAEARAYGGNEAPAFPITTCEHDMENTKLCGDCKGKATLKVDLITEDPWMNHPSLLRSGKPYEKNQAPPDVSFFTGAGMSQGDAEKQVPKQRSQSFRWAETIDLVKPKLSELSKLGSNMLCYCLGCCDPPKGKQSCFFPITQDILDPSQGGVISWSHPKLP